MRHLIVLVALLVAVTSAAVVGGLAQRSASGNTLVPRILADKVVGWDGPYTVDINGEKMPAPGVENWSIQVSWDPAVVVFGGCEATSPNEDFQGCLSPSDGQVVIAGGSSVGNQGDYRFGEITLICGTTPVVVTLDVTVIFLQDTNGVDIEAEAVDGSIECSPDAGTPQSTSTPAATPTPSLTPAEATETPAGPTGTPGPATGTPTPTDPEPEDTETPTQTPAGGRFRVQKLMLTIGGSEPLAGWTMFVHEESDCTGPIIATGVTGAGGIYVSPVLEPGSYSVEEEWLEDWVNDLNFCQSVFVVVDGETTLPPFQNEPMRNCDLNKDGVTNSLDVLLMLQSFAGLIPWLPNAEQADVNGDGQINTIDSALVLQYDAGLLQSLPVN